MNFLKSFSSLKSSSSHAVNHEYLSKPEVYCQGDLVAFFGARTSTLGRIEKFLNSPLQISSAREITRILSVFNCGPLSVKNASLAGNFAAVTGKTQGSLEPSQRTYRSKPSRGVLIRLAVILGVRRRRSTKKAVVGDISGGRGRLRIKKGPDMGWQSHWFQVCLIFPPGKVSSFSISLFLPSYFQSLSSWTCPSVV